MIQRERERDFAASFFDFPPPCPPVRHDFGVSGGGRRLVPRPLGCHRRHKPIGRISHPHTHIHGHLLAPAAVLRAPPRGSDRENWDDPRNPISRDRAERTPARHPACVAMLAHLGGVVVCVCALASALDRLVEKAIPDRFRTESGPRADLGATSDRSEERPRIGAGPANG